MKNLLMGLLTFLLICSTALNVFMFVQLEKLLGSSPQTQVSSNIDPSTPEKSLGNSPHLPPSIQEKTLDFTNSPQLSVATCTGEDPL